jgi:hypothetical protein
MGIDWPNTIVNDRTPYEWLEANVFPVDHLEPTVFEVMEVLYRCELHYSLLEQLVFGRPTPAPFSPDDLNRAVMAGCQSEGFELSAWWWNVNVHDNCARVVERIGTYRFSDPLVPLFIQLEGNPAEQGGTSYAGLLDCRYRWALSIESANEIIIAVHGPSSFCRAVSEFLQKQPERDSA